MPSHWTDGVRVMLAVTAAARWTPGPRECFDGDRAAVDECVVDAIESFDLKRIACTSKPWIGRQVVVARCPLPVVYVSVCLVVLR